MNVSRAGGAALALVGSLIAGSLCAPPAAADPAAAFPSPEEASRANDRTIGIALGRDARHFDLLDDIGASLGLAAGLRIVPMITGNDVQRVYDLFYLDGVDLALVRSDSIEYVRRVAGLTGARRLTRGVARVGGQKIAVVANAAHAGLDDLAGRPVGLGRFGSGESVTGTLLFDELGIAVEAVEADGERALEKVRSGELAATVRLLDARDGADAAPAGAPDAVARGAVARSAEGSMDGLVVLPLPRDRGLATLYRPATLDAADLPGLVPAGERVATYAVDLGLVAYAWGAENDRTRRVERFVEALVDRFEELRGDASQPEWDGVDLEADTPNLDGSPMVRRALARRAEAKARMLDAQRLAEAAPDAAAEPSEARVVLVKKDRAVVRLDAAALELEALDAEDPDRASAMDRLFGGLNALLRTPAERWTLAGTGGPSGDEAGGPVPGVAAPRPGVPYR